MKKPFFSALGFTLLELVMTLVLFGLVAIVAVSYFSKAVTRTDIPVTQLQTDASLQLVLENMIADAENRFSNNLNGFNDALSAEGEVSSQYGNGWNYVVTDKEFVCPEDGKFVASSTTQQFLLVTIKPNAVTDVNLSYIFSSAGAENNCAFPGGS